jgi:hypothetical protein
MKSADHAAVKTPENMLGLDYRREAETFRDNFPGEAIIDVHTHLGDLASAQVYFQAADAYGIASTWSQTPLEHVDAIADQFGDRVCFIAIPNYLAKDRDDTFTTDWLKRIEAFAEKGAKLCKFWAAPRGRDFTPHLQLDAPIRLQGMKLARSLGMSFMVHISDPDTWFATKYADAGKYGSKADQYTPLRRLLDQFGDVPWLAAHMAGDPEHLDHLQELLDAHPNLYLDTSATKWMVRELSKTPGEFRAFCVRNAGRVFFGTDIVTSKDNIGFDLYASRFWALRTLIETDYAGPSPIVDPDLHLVDPSVPEDATATLRGASIGGDTLQMLYHDAAAAFARRVGWIS